GAIVVIDDLSDRSHECDVLFDQNYPRAEEAYRSLTPSDTIILAGPDYAMLRPQFFSLKYKALKKFDRADQVKNIFVSFGSTDLQNLSSIALQVISEISSAITIDLSIGSGAPHLKSLNSLGLELANDVNIYVDHADMADLMMNADMAIAAAGLTAWERCCLGLPSIAVITAGNQKKVATELSNHGAAAVIRGHLSDIRGALLSLAKSLIEDPEKRINMSARAGSICDGLGVRRVLQAVDPSISGNGRRIQLRPATMDDASIIHVWQSIPETRRYARDSRIPEIRDHFEWMRKRLSDVKCVFNMIESDQDLVGVLRLDYQSKIKDREDVFEISIFMDPNFYRQGIALKALQLARDLMPTATIAAHVHLDNTASLRLFSKAGYLQRGEWFFSEAVE
ncbi:MAG: UDP-2,4-diacetamido-2,4,6-trideoxy-beta-L-altropyranose hydrolase, partial [Rhodospirillales bacterium]|nr:UDP-2,4-diacetamido-2,4,6-trideoxy-beta-L-altropyranose hydrolase [Rhodospirillales bacterium]